MKKYIDKLKDLKNTNKKLFIGIIFLFIFVGVTFAFVAAQISGGAFKLFNLGAQTTDQLEFVVDKDLSLTATQFNFVEGGNNLSDTSIATARLKANSTNKTANYNYNVYLVIEENEFKYTTSDKKTEILLQVTDPNGNSLTTLDGLTYNSTLQGFDITEEQGILAVAENFNISSNSSTNWTSQNWTFIITFINLDTNQKENAGKHMSGKIKIQQLTEVGNDITIAVNNLPEAYGPLATLNCKGSDSIYNDKYGRIEVSNINKNQSFCNITYNDRTEKQYFNDYIIGLEGTTQGNGELVHETFTNDSGELIDTGYRYEGQNPNNYIIFNGEIWRIIGVMNESSHGQTGLNLVKIIRNEPIGKLGYTYNSSLYGWNNACLAKILNEEYNNQSYSNNYFGCINHYGAIISFDFRAVGLKKQFDKMIEEANWYFGNEIQNDYEFTANDFYLNERSNLDYQYYAKIGLMYSSDYNYSVSYSTCPRSGRSYDCSGYQRWLNGYAREYVIGNYKGAYIDEHGYVTASNPATSNDFFVRPVVYLKNSIYKVYGDGSMNNPYIIGM